MGLLGFGGLRDVEQSLEDSAHRLYAVAKRRWEKAGRPVAVQVSSRRVSLLAASRARAKLVATKLRTRGDARNPDQIYYEEVRNE